MISVANAMLAAARSIDGPEPRLLAYGPVARGNPVQELMYGNLRDYGIAPVPVAIWSELDKAPSRTYTARKPMISSLRRNLQHEHVERLIDLSLPNRGFGAAAKIMQEEGGDEAVRLTELRDSLQAHLVESLDEVRINGGGAPRHPGNLNVSFGYIDGAALLLKVCEVAMHWS